MLRLDRSTSELMGEKMIILHKTKGTEIRLKAQKYFLYFRLQAKTKLKSLRIKSIINIKNQKAIFKKKINMFALNKI